MAGKVTLYVRDDDLWRRARQSAGRGGLSGLVQQCLRECLDRADAGSIPPPSPLERARQLRHDVDALVRVIEEQSPDSHPARPGRTRRRHRQS
jgi:hypothetical protein